MGLTGKWARESYPTVAWMYITTVRRRATSRRSAIALSLPWLLSSNRCYQRLSRRVAMQRVLPSSGCIVQGHWSHIVPRCLRVEPPISKDTNTSREPVESSHSNRPFHRCSLRDLSEVSSVKDSRHLLNIDGASIFNLPTNAHQQAWNLMIDDDADEYRIEKAWKSMVDNGNKRLHGKSARLAPLTIVIMIFHHNFPSSVHIQ